MEDYSKIIQGSREWRAIKAGKLSASRADELMAQGKGITRANLIATLAVERITGDLEQGYISMAMERGNALESEARDLYSFKYNEPVQEIAWVPHLTLDNVGCSPDGLVGEYGMIEIKSPESLSKHLRALLHGDHAKEYKWQLQFQLFVTGREWVDIVSFGERFPQALQLSVTRVERNEEMIEQLHDECQKADAEIWALIEQLKSKTGWVE